jgi:hypothetical protein
MKWTRQIYKTDTGTEMIELQRGESVSVNYALITGRITLSEIEQIKASAERSVR